MQRPGSDRPAPGFCQHTGMRGGGVALWQRVGLAGTWACELKAASRFAFIRRQNLNILLMLNFSNGKMCKYRKTEAIFPL
jgi:hypothetical protein